MLRLISVNIGQQRTLQNKDRIEQTGIFKFPASGAAKITSLGLEGDVIISKKHHGGPDQALYVYGAADYAWWSEELSREIPPGTFGDNLTVSELASAEWHIGDYLHIGAITLQITAPRIPCSTFAARMEDPQWVKKFRHAERPGLYCRVIKEGIVHTGDTASVEKYAAATISVLEMYRAWYQPNKSAATLRTLLNAPIAIRSRVRWEAELQNLLSAGNLTS